jgi:hypothetical protein
MVADNRNHSGLETPPSVSALGLRWAALRGMLASPLIDADEQRGLREELLRELQAIEHDFAAVPARTAIEVSAKIDVVKTGLRDSVADAPPWILSVLNSVQSDLRSIGASAPAVRSPANLTRAFPPRQEPAAATTAEPVPPPTEE